VGYAVVTELDATEVGTAWAHPEAVRTARLNIAQVADAAVERGGLFAWGVMADTFLRNCYLAALNAATVPPS
jgi:hypothetical protein